MKKTIKLAVVAALALGATSAFATNGDLMIGQGAKSRAMGGVGIAKSFGAESGLANPAMLSSVKDSEFTFVVTYFNANVEFGTNAGANAQSAVMNNITDFTTNPYTFNPVPQAGSTAAITMSTSAAAPSVIPELAYAKRLNDNTVVGFSLSGTAGMGTDYTNQSNGAFQMKTALSLLKVAVPVSYTVGGFTAGLTGVMQYGSLAMAHDTLGTPEDNGPSTDIGYGLEAGVSYDMEGLGAKGLTLGAVYKSKIGMTYDDVISKSLVAFGVDAASRMTNTGSSADAITSGDNLDQPEERGIGISYEIAGNTITADYKNIAWGDAAGYSDFGWENQDVYALGYEYATKTFAIRAGYNYAKSPIAEQDGTQYVGAIQNFFNLSGFPGIVETHFTLGGGYNISDALSIDGAVIYVPEVTASFDTTGFSQGAAMNMAMQYGASQAEAMGISGQAQASEANVKHSQTALTLAMSYKF